MKILILDNYDSFTYNLVHYVEDITGTLPDVYRNDEISIEEIVSHPTVGQARKNEGTARRGAHAGRRGPGAAPASP